MTTPQPASVLHRHGVPAPVEQRFVHLDGTECVAGYEGETLECATGGGVIVRMDAYLTLTSNAKSCSCGKPFPEDGGAEGVCECCSTCTNAKSVQR